MKTIQVREIPDDAYEEIRSRARAEGKSLQSYMRDQVIALARRPSKAEAVAVLEEALAEYGPTGLDTETIVRDRDSERR